MHEVVAIQAGCVGAYQSSRIRLVDDSSGHTFFSADESGLEIADIVVSGDSVELAITFRHPLLIPSPERGLEVAFRPDSVSESGEQELVARVHEVTPDRNPLFDG